MKRLLMLIISILIVAALAAVYFLFLSPARRSAGTVYVVPWIRNPQDHPDWPIQALSQCEGAPFLLPTNGLVGYLWDDTFKIGSRHQGIDIFGGTDINVTPVYAAYDGYLTRLPDWKSSVIIRIPSDPLQPGRQIWTYYTHMADPNGNSFISADFPPGTNEVFVKAGTLLGHQGDYSGDPKNPVGVHLHFSIVKDNGSGKFLNELDINNTLDPSPYLGLTLNNNEHPAFPIKCKNLVNQP
jgi:murein DD-endopeptidase MepM/ murein hydrolase activator NlpD